MSEQEPFSTPQEQVTNWQSIDRLLDRIQVPGGWLYRTWGFKKAEPAMVFVPHPIWNH